MKEGRWNIPASWEWETIANLTKVIGGGTPASKDETNFEAAGKGHHWLTPADLSKYKDLYITYGRRDISEKGLNSSSAKILPPNSVLFTCRAPIGYCVINKKEISTNQGFKSFTPPPELLPKFCAFYLKSSKTYAESKASGTTFLELSAKKFGELLLPLPPLPEQKRIVKKLDDCQQQIDSSSEALAKLPQLLADYRASLLASAFRGDLTAKWRAEQKAQGIQHESAQDLLKRLRQERQQQWQKTELQKYKVKGKTPPKGWEGKYKKPDNNIKEDFPNLSIPTSWLNVKWTEIGNVASNLVKVAEYQNSPHIAPNTIEKDTGQLLAYKTIKEDKVKSAKNYFHQGQILYSKIRPYLNKCVIATFNGLCSADMYPVDSKINVNYLHRFMLSKQFLHSISIAAGSRVTLPKVNATQLNSIPVPLPPLAEQAEIVRILEIAFTKIDSIESLHSKLTTEHTQLTQSLLAKAFRGELVPQNPDDEPASILLKCIQEQRSQDEVAPKIKKKQSKRTKSTNKKTMNKSRFDEEVHEKPYLRDLLKTNSDLDTAEKLFNQSQLNLVDFYKQLDWETKTDFIESKNSKLQITS